MVAIFYIDDAEGKPRARMVLGEGYCVEQIGDKLVRVSAPDRPFKNFDITKNETWDVWEAVNDGRK